MLAQTTSPGIIGDYYLSGVRETDSGFRLNTDSTFEFFFSQGALDRHGKGHYKCTKDSISFSSDLVHSNDFALLSSKNQPGNQTVIRIVDPNEHLLQYVFIRVKTGNETKEGFADSKGYFKCDGNDPVLIELMFEFCPEKITSITIPPGKHNYFEFKFEPWLFEYFFTGFSLRIDGSQLTGGHPLLKGTTFIYSK